MNKLFFALLSLVSFAAAAQETNTINDPQAQKRALTASFTAISVSDGIDLYLSQGSEESVAVSASEEKYLMRLKTEVENGTLRIYYENKGFSWSGDKRKLKAYVSFKSLEKLVASGGAEVQARGSFELMNCELHFTSGSTFAGKINAKGITVEQNSGSVISLSGRADKIKVETSSGASFKGYELAVDFCDANASSGGAVRITINKELNAKASSGGDIHYKGEALIRDISISSGGQVKRS
jgi:Putative auto-transporter adhesin, head GIN domain